MITNQTYYWLDDGKIGIGYWDGSEMQPISSDMYVIVKHNEVFPPMDSPTDETWKTKNVPIPDEFAQTLISGVLHYLYEGEAANPEKLEMSKHFYMVFRSRLNEMKKYMKSSLIGTAHIKPIEY